MGFLFRKKLWCWRRFWREKKAGKRARKRAGNRACLLNVAIPAPRVKKPKPCEIYMNQAVNPWGKKYQIHTCGRFFGCRFQPRYVFGYATCVMLCCAICCSKTGHTNIFIWTPPHGLSPPGFEQPPGRKTNHPRSPPRTIWCATHYIALHSIT